MRKIIASFLLAACACYGPLLFCGHPQRHVTRAVYFWQTDFYLGTEEQAFLKAHQVEKIYAKIMDIDWNAAYGAYPTTSTPVSRQLERDSSTELIPVVFITNEVFRHTEPRDMNILANKIILKTAQLCGNAEKIRELQVDCDWSASTKQAYFALLTSLKQKWPGSVLSATIRLHQFKNSRQAGVPPVDRGMLMMYNMGRIADYDERNSIFNSSEALPYLVNAEAYPLPLDMALPSFNWGIVFRNHHIERIFHRITRQVADTCSFLVKEPNGMYRVNTDYWSDGAGHYLRYGDEIRIEDIDDKTLLQAAAMARQAVNTSNVTVSLFELGSSVLTRIDSLAYEKVFDRFK